MKKSRKICRLADKCITNKAESKWVGFCLFSLKLLRLWDTLFSCFQTVFQTSHFRRRKKLWLLGKKDTPLPPSPGCPLKHKKNLIWLQIPFFVATQTTCVQHVSLLNKGRGTATSQLLSTVDAKFHAALKLPYFRQHVGNHSLFDKEQQQHHGTFNDYK